jgi:uncharacterized protein YjbI with pentapeptide repeats
MSQKLPEAPQLSGEQLTNCDLSEFSLRTEADYESFHFTGVGGGDAAHTRWAGCHFERARLSAVIWTAGHWEDLQFAGCDLANASAEKLYATRTHLQDCRLLGWRANESIWRDAMFRECPASMAQFSLTRFERVRFEKCDLSDTDFTGADLRGVVFRDCDLKGADFTGARLQDADWRGSEVERLKVDVRSLRGLIVSPSQAAHFAKLMGLRIKAPEGEAE